MSDEMRCISMAKVLLMFLCIALFSSCGCITSEKIPNYPHDVTKYIVNLDNNKVHVRTYSYDFDVASNSIKEINGTITKVSQPFVNRKQYQLDGIVYLENVCDIKNIENKGFVWVTKII